VGTPVVCANAAAATNAAGNSASTIAVVARPGRAGGKSPRAFCSNRRCSRGHGCSRQLTRGRTQPPGTDEATRPPSPGRHPSGGPGRGAARFRRALPSLGPARGRPPHTRIAVREGGHEAPGEHCGGPRRLSQRRGRCCRARCRVVKKQGRYKQYCQPSEGPSTAVASRKARRGAWPPRRRRRRRRPPRRARRHGEPRARRRGGAVRGGGGGGGGGGRHPPFPRRDRGGDPASSLKTYRFIPISSPPRR